MKEKDEIKEKNQIINEEDFNISITNEHNDQDVTSMGETGKSSGIISVMAHPHFNFTYINKYKLYNKRIEPTIQKEDTYSMYTNVNKVKNNNSNSLINDDMNIEVSKNFLR